MLIQKYFLYESYNYYKSYNLFTNYNQQKLVNKNISKSKEKLHREFKIQKNRIRTLIQFDGIRGKLLNVVMEQSSF